MAAFAALLAYANSLGNGFVWDDPIILSRQLVVFRSPADVLVPPRDIPQFSPDYYRPLTIATYLWDRAVGGGEPLAFHASVVVAHALSAALVCSFAASLLPSGAAGRAGALVAGLLFALHPIHTESVAWAAGRSDVLATLFMLAALVLHGRPGSGSWRGSAATGVCAAAALGAKETGVALYPLMLLHDLLLPGRAVKPRAYAGAAVAGAVYVLLRHQALGEFVGTAPQEAPVQRSPWEVAAAFGTYLEKLIWPLGLNAYIDHIAVAAGPLLLAGAFVAALGVAAWRWWTARGDGTPLYALSWIALTLVPSLAILWKIPDAPMAERYLFLPSVGYCLLVGDLLARVLERLPVPARRALSAAVAALLIAAAAATVRRNPVWADDVTLWEDTEAKSQVSGMAARSLGTAYQQAGRIAEARAAFERALARRNSARGLQTIHNNLGTLAMYDGAYDLARRHYEAALAANPGAPDTIFNLGLVILQAGDASPAAARAALPYFQRAGATNPHDPDIEAGLGQIYLILGERRQARAHLERALELGPDARTEQGVRALLTQARAEP